MNAITEWSAALPATEICFDRKCESRVVGIILRTLSALLRRTFTAPPELNRHPRELAAA